MSKDSEDDDTSTSGYPRRYSDKQIIAALHNSHGGLFLAAEELGCSYKTIERRAKEVAKVGLVLDHYKWARVDLAEKKLDEALQRGDPWAIQFALKTLGKVRGYVERQEVTGENGNSIVVTIKKSGK